MNRKKYFIEYGRSKQSNKDFFAVFQWCIFFYRDGKGNEEISGVALDDYNDLIQRVGKMENSVTSIIGKVKLFF